MIQRDIIHFFRNEMSSESSKRKIFVGFDGFVDSIIHPVDQRKSASEWTRIQTIPELANRISASSGKSTNIECVETCSLLGGNAPLLAQSLATVGENDVDISLAGTFSLSKENTQVDSIFASLLTRENIKYTSLGPSGKTNAFEFNDGKILFGTMRGVDQISLEDLFQIIPESLFLQHLPSYSAIATVNWTMMPLVHQFWKWLGQKSSITLNREQRPYLFIDFADPKKRPFEDLLEALEHLRNCAQKGFKIILSLNLSEALQVMRALGLQEVDNISLSNAIESIKEKEDLFDIIVGHSHKEVSAISHVESKQLTASFPVPYIENPTATTGAGDAFNAGFLYAISGGLSIQSALLWALATSGIWVRTRTPATRERALSFIAEYQSNRPR